MSMSQQAIDEAASLYVGPSGMPGDATNAYFATAMNVGDVDAAHLLKPARRYADYIRNVKFAKNPKMAEGVIRFTNKDLMAKFDDAIERMNAIVKGSARPGKKKEEVSAILDELGKWL